MITTRYFESWSGKAVPFKPVKEISQSEAESLRSYYIGTFDGKNLILFEKRLDGAMEWKDHYSYWPGTIILKERKMVKQDGSTIVQEFSKRGKYVRDLP